MRWHLVAEDIKPLSERRDLSRALKHDEKLQLVTRVKPQVVENMVDVAGIEPATPCLQIQKANLDGVKKNEKK